MQGWKSGSDYPDIDSLSGAYRDKTYYNLRNMLGYFAATAVVAAVFWVISSQWLVLAGAVVLIVCIFLWMVGKLRGYNKISKRIATEDFTWTVAKLQNKYKRDVFDMSAGPQYQIKCHEEWLDADMTTYNDCEIGKPVVLINLGDMTVATPIPKGVKWKSLKALARA